MIRIGLLDFDGHAGLFSHWLNNPEVPEAERIPGATVVAGYADPAAAAFGEEGLRAAIANCQKWGVEMLEHPEDLLGRIDAAMVCAVNGRFHLEKARPFLKAGIPVFIDKPFANTLADARELVRLAEESGTPLFSSSSTRCATAVREVLEGGEQFGAVLGMSACGPTIPLGGEYPVHGLQFYGVHTIELVNQMMGGGVNWVSSVTEGERNVLTVGWADGRMASLLLGSGHHSPGPNAHSFIAWCEKDIVVRYLQPDGHYLLRQVIQFFRDGKSPVGPDQSLEVVAIVEAAMTSEARRGARVVLS